jgi:hypothetical protein
MALIIKKSIPQNERFTQADVRTAVSPEELKDSLPDGAKLLSVTTMKIEGELAGLIEFSGGWRSGRYPGANAGLR